MSPHTAESPSSWAELWRRLLEPRADVFTEETGEPAVDEAAEEPAGNAPSTDDLAHDDLMTNEPSD